MIYDESSKISSKQWKYLEERMTKQESHLKSQFMELARKEMQKFVLFRHEDFRTGGIPDLSVTGFLKTSWWEFKHGTPHFETKGIQELTMLRLAAVGFAFYIIFEETETHKRTLIVHPRDIKAIVPAAFSLGFDYKFIIDFMKRIHRVPGT